MRTDRKKIIIALAAALGVSGLAGAGAVQAATLQTGDVLAFIGGVPTDSSTTQRSSGSYFSAMKNKSNNEEYVSLQPGSDGGIKIGTVQTTPGAIDVSWSFPGSSGTIAGSEFTITGTSDVNSNLISGVVPIDSTTLDMSNWRGLWNRDTIDLGGCVGSACPYKNDKKKGGRVTDTHEATFNWDGTYGDSFTLDYQAHIPTDSPLVSARGQPYNLYMTGVVEPVPIPAAAWLFGSGLLGLVGLARRKKSG